MKDLITAIGSVIILMIFCMQFCSNQVIAMRVFAANSILQNQKIEVGGSQENEQAIDIKKSIAKCLGCKEEEVSISPQNEQLLVEAPVKNVIACSALLGISPTENKFTYKGIVRKNEEFNNNTGNYAVDDNAQ